MCVGVRVRVRVSLDVERYDEGEESEGEDQKAVSWRHVCATTGTLWCWSSRSKHACEVERSCAAVEWCCDCCDPLMALIASKAL